MQNFKTDFSRDVVALAGLPFDTVNLDSAYEYINFAIESGQHCFLTTPNLNFIISALDDEKFRNSVLMSDLVVADGMPIVWLAKFLSLSITERVAGSSLFERFLQTPVLKKKKVFFFGGPDGAGLSAQKNLKHSNVDCCGFISPGFRSVAELSTEEYISAINSASPDFLIVALGAKKGQEWIIHNYSRLNVPAISHLGAVVNFVAGSVTRAPIIIQRLGLEWMWRIKEEPSLWKRYYFDGMQAIKLILSTVIPLYWQTKKNKSSTKNSDFSFYIQESKDKIDIFIRGSLISQQIQTFKNYLIHDFKYVHQVNISCAELTHIDSVGIGLLMLMFGHQLKLTGTLSLSNVPKHIRKIFVLHSAEYML
jgi:N-acetylglucosaminyldiphosphoundecaprenol N-acetyl-beta-D-mannosaminyltransferase